MLSPGATASASDAHKPPIIPLESSRRLSQTQIYIQLSLLSNLIFLFEIQFSNLVYLPFFSFSEIIKSSWSPQHQYLLLNLLNFKMKYKRLSLAFFTELGTNIIHIFISPFSQTLTNTMLITFLLFLLRILMDYVMQHGKLRKRVSKMSDP